jgi:hypothetical protein
MNEALNVLQFATLYQLLKESIKVADGDLLMSLYKPSLAVFESFHRTKYRFGLFLFFLLLLFFWNKAHHQLGVHVVGSKL